jgi:hypothetical protein
LLYRHALRLDEGLNVLDGATGDEIMRLPGTTQWGGYPSVVVADVDGDGAAEIVAVHHSQDAGVRVYRDASGSWVRARPIWSGQSYHVTNVRDDGVVPATEPKSWLVHGTYRTQLGDLSPSAPNLTISVVERRVRVLPDCSRVLDATARVGNAGGLPNVEPFSAWLFDGDPAAGGTLLASAVIDVLGPGEWQDLPVTVPLAGPGALTLHALVDDDLAGAGTVRECREDDNACTALVENPPDGGDVRPADVGPSLRVRDAGDPTLPTITATLDWSLDPRLPRTGEHYHVMRGVAPDRLGFLAGLEPYLPTSILDATPARPPGPQPLVHHYRVLAADACEQVSRE